MMGDNKKYILKKKVLELRESLKLKAGKICFTYIKAVDNYQPFPQFPQNKNIHNFYPTFVQSCRKKNKKTHPI